MTRKYSIITWDDNSSQICDETEATENGPTELDETVLPNHEDRVQTVHKIEKSINHFKFQMEETLKPDSGATILHSLH